MTKIKAIMMSRVGSYEDFYNANLVYDRGEQTHVTSGADAGRWKVGDGITPWRGLPFSPRTAALNARGAVAGSAVLFFGKINPDGTFTLNGIAEAVDRIDTTAALHGEQITAIQTQLAGMSGTIIYIGTIDKYTDELEAMDDAARDALLTARAIEIRGQVMDGYTLQDLGLESEPGRFNYWQYQDDGTWFNLGERGEVSQATDSDLGIVLGSGTQYKIHIEPDGTMSVNGLAAELQALESADEELAGDIQETDGRLSEFEAAQAETNNETAQAIADINAAAEELSGDFGAFKTAQLENNGAQAEGISAAQGAANAAAGVAAAALDTAQGRIAKGIFADANGALVADMAITPETGSLANISKTLKNVDNGENFTLNVHLTSADGTISSDFSQQDERNYTLNLEASKPQAAAEAAQETANTALLNAALAAQDAANAQHAADAAQDTADGKVDADYVDDKIAQAQLAVQTWLPAVQTKADLPDPSTLSHTTSYLCRVINDTDTPSNNGVWQLVAGEDEWTYFSDNTDFIDETEMAAAIAEEKNDRNTAIGEEATARDTAISQAIAGEVTDRNGAIDTKVDTASTGTITEDTNKFPASTVITFANFFKSVVSKINGIITALGTKQNTLVSGSNIKTINNNSLVGSGNIAISGGGLSQFTYLVDSDAALAAWADSEAGNDYASVLIAPGTWNSSKEADLTAAGTKTVTGMPGSLLKFTSAYGLRYTSLPDGNDCRMYNVTVEMTGVVNGTNGFCNCTNLTNCAGTGTGGTSGTGFYNCKGMVLNKSGGASTTATFTGCYVSISGSGTAPANTAAGGWNLP
jgi:hypothetical protein